MLDFILGRAKAGKSYEILNRIETAVRVGEKPILLVPEQFSFESERAVLLRLGDSLYQNASVLSFTRLCDEIERQRGGICGKTLTDSDKYILIKRAIKRASGELKLWGAYENSNGFASGILELIEEFKLEAVSPDDLTAAAGKTSNEKLKNKLFDIALIFSAYNELIAENFIDPSDRLDKLYFSLLNDDYFKGRPVFLDSFKGFTGQQFKILDLIIASAKNVTVSLTFDTEDNREYGIFRNIRKTYLKIRQIAEKYNVEIGENTLLTDNKYENPSLKNLESLIFSGKTRDKSANGVTVCRADSIYDEAEFAARNIRRIVREKGAKYSDFVIIARDTEIYEEALRVACIKNGVSCFSDKRQPLSSMPIAVALLSAIESVPSFNSEKIFKFLKSGIGILDSEEIAELENYTYIWNISGKKWCENWDMNPDGFSERVSSKAQEKLSIINTLRERAIAPLTAFADNFCGSPANMTKALVSLLEDTKADVIFGELSKKAEQAGDYAFADTVRTSWDVMMSLLNSIVMCFSSAKISHKEYTEALTAAINNATVGVIPQMIDEVTFGAADRIRPSRPKYAFIMGANHSVFPKSISKSGILALNERKDLIDLKLNISDHTLDSSIDEDFLVYSNVCCASSEVYISYTNVLADGSEGHPAAFLKAIIENLDVRCFSEPMPLSALNAPETDAAAFSELCKRVSNKQESATILGGANEEFRKKAEALFSSSNKENAKISPDTAQKLFGTTLYMSPTRFDDLSHCKFKHFCKYGLRAKTLYPAEFSGMQKGTLIHFVLQKIIEQYSADIKNLSSNQIKKEVDRLSEQYLDSIEGYRSIETPRFTYIVSNIKRSLYYVVERLSLEFKQSDFVPIKCELEIGKDGDIPPIDILVEGYGNLLLNGKVDRVDSFNGYIRVIDYKSGIKAFKLPDILFGLNMQMLLYLYTLTKDEKYGGKPAGVLYAKAKRVNDGTPAQRRMSGILLADSDVVTAMERENKGEFVPKFDPDKKSEAFISGEDFDKIFGFITKKLKADAKNVFEGDISADPVDGLESDSCKYCDFASVCRIGDKKPRKVDALKTAEVLKIIDEEGL